MTTPPFDPPHQGRVAGWKVARVIVADDDSLRFAGLAAASVPTTFYDAESTAHCAIGRSHRVPGWDCSCGFHVAPDLTSLSSMYDDWDQPMFVLLEVEVSGVVVEHEHGVRAEAQRVLGCRFADRCAWCDEAATCLATSFRAPKDGGWFGPVDLPHVVPTCERCRLRNTMSPPHALADLAGRLGVEVAMRATPTASARARARAEAVTQPRPTRRARLGAVVALAATGSAAVVGALLGQPPLTATAAVAAAVTYTALAATTKRGSRR